MKHTQPTNRAMAEGGFNAPFGAHLVPKEEQSLAAVISAEMRACLVQSIRQDFDRWLEKNATDEDLHLLRDALFDLIDETALGRGSLASAVVRQLPASLFAAKLPVLEGRTSGGSVASR
jgi:hypothetical protein